MRSLFQRFLTSRRQEQRKEAERFCAHCGAPTHGEPPTLWVSGRTLFFCCRGCLAAYKAVHKIE
jgi:hypothetical protein